MEISHLYLHEQLRGIWVVTASQSPQIKASRDSSSCLLHNSVAGIEKALAILRGFLGLSAASSRYLLASRRLIFDALYDLISRPAAC
jgi:hypothetical protein